MYFNLAPSHFLLCIHKKVANTYQIKKSAVWLTFRLDSEFLFEQCGLSFGNRSEFFEGVGELGVV